jgi:hypothetical protein
MLFLRNAAVPGSFERHLLAGGDPTGWLGREDSNLCISKSDPLNFIVAQPDLGRLTPETFLRSAARAHQFEMRKFESCALG